MRHSRALHYDLLCIAEPDKRRGLIKTPRLLHPRGRRPRCRSRERGRGKDHNEA